MRHVNGSSCGPGRLVSGGTARGRLSFWFRGRLVLAASGCLIGQLCRCGAGGFLVAGLFQGDLFLDRPLFSRGLVIGLLLTGGLLLIGLLLISRPAPGRLLIRWGLIRRLLRICPGRGRDSGPGRRSLSVGVVSVGVLSVRSPRARTARARRHAVRGGAAACRGAAACPGRRG